MLRNTQAEGIQARRAVTPVTCGLQGVVHDYVPFYFGSVSPMLLGVVNKKNIDQYDILYFEFPITILEQDHVVFTDASANTTHAPNFFSNPAKLDQLNWAEIDSRKWSSSTDELRHQRMAEVLVHQQIPLSMASACVVWNKSAKSKVEKLTLDVIDFPRVEFQNFDRSHYFVNFMTKGSEKNSLVTGPKSIASTYEQACELLKKHIGKNGEAARFKGPIALLNCLREDFGCIPETAELIDLETVNKVHKETVDVHTQQVVDTLLGLPELQDLHRRLKKLVELAAYLHDIGKGPKERWRDEKTGKCFQRNDPDHPLRSMGMLVRIFTQELKYICFHAAKIILKLVCYHDLVGDVLGRGRNESQIVDVADNEEELRLLFLLGKADATTLKFNWPQGDADALFERTLAGIEAK